ncbi:DUF6428 family protein [Roseivirga sp. UBA1976]|uniref:DUF6428 family protein n=1 Tax=Roseivirga sp. UBA1976 TaxID=1947386 RepID=UPI00257FD5CB|nr:DUF6428 family protein [Roseivirga sp. UBA1976]|tara:strand:+ start:9860 stop:10330 length:471 start_codon:yes stop_codon:yes gene_type:complete
MNLSEIKSALSQVNEVIFTLPNGEQVPPHFHVTEVGNIQKHFIDCGGTIRKESVINFQLFTATDYDHRLSAQKLRSIIELSEEKLGLENLEIEVEYQGDTIGKYGLEFQNGVFQLTSTQTDCLAKDKCGIPQEKPRIRLSTLQAQESGCTPGSGCC